LNNIIEIACSVIFTVCAFLKHWEGMYKDEEKSNMCAGAEQLVQKTQDFVGIREDLLGWHGLMLEC
jgi:hypothetical protein